MKKLLMPLLVIAGLAPLASCVSPYYYDSYGYGYGDERYAPYGDGYNPYYAYGGGYGYGRGSYGFGYRGGRAYDYYNGY
jgi:hypothetical protein